MGFLSNLFGFSNPQNASTDDRNSTWNRLFDEGHAIENDFNEFMIQHGITQDVYIFDVEFVNQGSAAVTAEKRRVDSLKGKILEFISEGGCAQYITNVDKMDDYLEKIRYMKEKDMMGIHTQFINSPLQEIKEIVESVERDRYADSISNTNNINSLSGTEFEVVCKHLIEKMGFTAEMTKATGDGGIDIIAYNPQPLLSGKYIIQCKRYSGSVGEPIIRDLYGVVTSERANKGILMTTGTFTAPAIRFAEGKPLELIDGSKFLELLGKKDDISSDNIIKDSLDLDESLAWYCSFIGKGIDSLPFQCECEDVQGLFGCANYQENITVFGIDGLLEFLYNHQKAINLLIWRSTVFLFSNDRYESFLNYLIERFGLYSSSQTPDEQNSSPNFTNDTYYWNNANHIQDFTLTKFNDGTSTFSISFKK